MNKRNLRVNSLVFCFCLFLMTADYLRGAPVLGDISFEFIDKDELVRITAEQAQKLIGAKAKETVLAIKNKDMAKLSGFVHPTKGVWFSHNLVVDKKTNLVFTRKQVKTLFENKKRYLWSEEYAETENQPVRLTFPKYYQRFIYDKDYVAATEVSYIQENPGRAYTSSNILEVYPNALLVEYRFLPVEDARKKYIHGTSLLLVFEKFEETFYLAGIVHDEWTP